MSYSSLRATDTDYSVPSLTRTNAEDAAAVRAHYRADYGTLQTTILLSPEIARVAGFRAGTRVTVLRGTGKDAGKVRLVANRNGTLKFGKTKAGESYTIRLRTSRLLTRRTNTKPATVTSYGKGAVTLSL
jgi:hypothetical protein